MLLAGGTPPARLGIRSHTQRAFLIAIIFGL
jgi:hypothetical protein